MKVHLLDHNNILMDFKRGLELVGSIAEADIVVVWQDVTGYCKDLAQAARLADIPCVVVEHGLGSHIEYLPDNLAFPLIGNVFCCWSKKGCERMEAGGIAPERLRVVGTTIFDHLTSHTGFQGKRVTFSPLHWLFDLPESRQIAQKLREIPDIKVTTKLIDGHEDEFYDNVVLSDRSKDDHLSICADVLSKTDVLVSNVFSTFELLACYLDIPVIVVGNWVPKDFLGRWTPDPILIHSDAYTHCTLEELPAAIADALKHPGKLSKQRKAVLRDEASVGVIEKPVERFHQILEEIHLTQVN